MVILRVEIDSDKEPGLFQAVSRVLIGMDTLLDPKIFPVMRGMHGGWQATIYGELATKVSELLKEGAWIQAIKQGRQDRGLALKEAKHAVDDYRDYLRSKGYLPKQGSEFRTERAFRS